MPVNAGPEGKLHSHTLQTKAPPKGGVMHEAPRPVFGDGAVAHWIYEFRAREEPAADKGPWPPCVTVNTQHLFTFSRELHCRHKRTLGAGRGWRRIEGQRLCTTTRS